MCNYFEEAKTAAKKITDKAADAGVEVSNDAIQRAVLDSIRALMLIRAYRIRGHLAADLDPLGMRETTAHPELDPKSYGFTPQPPVPYSPPASHQDAGYHPGWPRLFPEAG